MVDRRWRQEQAIIFVFPCHALVVYPRCIMSSRDEELLSQFEGLSLSMDSWNQRTHVALAYLYLQRFGFSGALEELRLRIKAFNAHHQIEEAPTSGYNETTTVAMLRLVHATMNTYEDIFPVTSAEEFCVTHPQLMSKHILRFFYSPKQRMRPEAKSTFVEPDLTPLPKVEESQ